MAGNYRFPGVETRRHSSVEARFSRETGPYAKRARFVRRARRGRFPSVSKRENLFSFQILTRFFGLLNLSLICSLIRNRHRSENDSGRNRANEKRMGPSVPPGADGMKAVPNIEPRKVSAPSSRERHPKPANHRSAQTRLPACGSWWFAPDTGARPSTARRRRRHSCARRT